MLEGGNHRLDSYLNIHAKTKVQSCNLYKEVAVRYALQECIKKVNLSSMLMGTIKEEKIPQYSTKHNTKVGIESKCMDSIPAQNIQIVQNRQETMIKEDLQNLIIYLKELESGYNKDLPFRSFKDFTRNPKIEKYNNLMEEYEHNLHKQRYQINYLRKQKSQFGSIAEAMPIRNDAKVQKYFENHYRHAHVGNTKDMAIVNALESDSKKEAEINHYLTKMKHEKRSHTATQYCFETLIEQFKNLTNQTQVKYDMALEDCDEKIGVAQNTLRKLKLDRKFYENEIIEFHIAIKDRLRKDEILAQAAAAEEEELKNAVPIKITAKGKSKKKQGNQVDTNIVKKKDEPKQILESKLGDLKNLTKKKFRVKVAPDKDTKKITKALKDNN